MLTDKGQMLWLQPSSMCRQHQEDGCGVTGIN